MDATRAIASMYMEAPAEDVWHYLATPAGMNAYLTDEVTCERGEIGAGDAVQIVIGDMVDEAVCLACERPRLFRLKDRFRTLLADGSFLSYELTTTFRLEQAGPMTLVTVTAEGYDERSPFMRWLRDCGEWGWKMSLFSLKNALELGLDLRYSIFGYPRLGVCNMTAGREQIEEQGLRPEETRGNFLLEVFPDSPAARAGLSKGDLVVSIGGFPVPDYGEFVKALALSLHRNDAVDISYYRGGKRATARAALSSDVRLTGLVQPTEESVARIKNANAHDDAGRR